MLASVFQYLHSRVMAHRNGKRLWLQGVRPNVAGFVVGAKYRVVELGSTIELIVDPNGDRTVSRKKTLPGVYVPVMDIRLTSSEFDVDDRIRIVFCNGRITVAHHHEARAKKDRERRFINAIASGQIREGSLCTGGGISAAATHQATRDAGIEPTLAYVVDESMKYLQIAGSNNYAITDETQFFVSRLEEVETQFIEPVDLLSFSLPCAGFSRAGAARHKLSPEEHSSAPSLFGLRNFIKASNPAVLWSENVTTAQNSPLYILLKAELTRLGYRISEDVTSNEKTGSLECRPRYWFLAVSDGLDPALDAQVFDYALLKKHNQIGSIRSAEADQDESLWSQNSYLKAKQLADEAAGKGFAKRQLLSGSEPNIGTIGRFYSKKRSTEPFWVRDDGAERLLTVEEHCAVKQVPPVLVRDVCSTIAHEILGQGIDYMQCYIPILRLFENAKRIYGQWLSKQPPTANHKLEFISF